MIEPPGPAFLVREVRRQVEKCRMVLSRRARLSHLGEHRAAIDGDRIPEAGVFGQQFARLIQIGERFGPERDVALPKPRNHLVRPPCRGLVAPRIVEASDG